jgi:hypothetical protein
MPTYTITIEEGCEEFGAALAEGDIAPRRLSNRDCYLFFESELPWLSVAIEEVAYRQGSSALMESLSEMDFDADPDVVDAYQRGFRFFVEHVVETGMNQQYENYRDAVDDPISFHWWHQQIVFARHFDEHQTLMDDELAEQILQNIEAQAEKNLTEMSDEECFEWLSLLWSNEDLNSVTDLVRRIGWRLTSVVLVGTLFLRGETPSNDLRTGVWRALRYMQSEIIDDAE